MTALPAIEGYGYESIKQTKSDSTKCQLQQCNQYATSKCSKSLCKFSFCSKHATHKHFICQYCPYDQKENLATCEILIDDLLACKTCSDLLYKTRVCPKCKYWMPKLHASQFKYCYDCSSKCALCKKCISVMTLYVLVVILDNLHVTDKVFLVCMDNSNNFF